MGYRYDQYHAAVTSLGIATGQRFDANETAAFARQLEDIDLSSGYKVQYPELKGDKIIPIRTAINEGAEEYTYRVMDKAGLARVIANYAEDLPRVDVQGKEVTTKLFGLGASFGYSTQDLRRSRMLSVALDAERPWRPARPSRASTTRSWRTATPPSAQRASTTSPAWTSCPPA